MVISTRTLVQPRRPREPVTDPRSRIGTPTAVDLAETLGRLRLDGLALPRGATRLVTRAIVDWAERRGWLPVTEMPLEFLFDTPEYPGRQGVVDLYIARPGYKRDLVIEIDRGNKSWSAAKLGHCFEAGKAAIWVRWSGLGPPAAIVPGGVEVIFLEVGRKARLQQAPRTDSVPEVASHPGGLSGASRALLAALYPTEAPAEDDVWRDEKSIWAAVAQLRAREALVVRCRFGHFGPRPLTLSDTAEVVADELDMDVVSRERIRQLQVRALRQLRLKSAARVRAARRAAGLPEPAKEPRVAKPHRAKRRTPSIVAIDRDTLRPLVVDVLRATGAHRIGPAMVCHILRGSHGPMTRQLVADFKIPHDGELRELPFDALRHAVMDLIASQPFKPTPDGRIVLEAVGLSASDAGRGSGSDR